MKIVRQSLAVALTGVLATVSMSGAGPVQPKKAIRHVVVIFQENVSFDHYFATYPNALNPGQEPAFTALPATPRIESLSGGLLMQNPNYLNDQNGEDARIHFGFAGIRLQRAIKIIDTKQSNRPSTTKRWTCFQNRSAVQMDRGCREKKRAYLRPLV
jgi:hypothetical protein